MPLCPFQVKPVSPPISAALSLFEQLQLLSVNSGRYEFYRLLKFWDLGQGVGS